MALHGSTGFSFKMIHHLCLPTSNIYGPVVSNESAKRSSFRISRRGFSIGLQNLGLRHFKQAGRLPTCRPCRIKSDDSGDVWGSDELVMDAAMLERDLRIAIDEENYAKAAKIRDSLRDLHESNKSSVLAVNAKFYNAFRSGDLAAMQTLWAKSENACCVHPGAGGIPGYDNVIESWEYVLAHYEFPLEMELKNVLVDVKGDMGYVSCVELVKTKGSSWGKQYATNVFERIDGQWYICVHHASPIDL